MYWFWWLCLIIVTAFVVFKLYYKLSTKWNGSYTCLVGKTAIITGGNAGLGYITALDFAKRGARVILACRSKERAEDAQEKIIKATGNQNVVYKLMDAASLQSVRDFAADINKTENRIDILVNNAGLGYMEKDFTVDGLQGIFHVNHITPFLLTHLLIDKLKRSGYSRIINVSSIVANYSKLNASNIDKVNEIPSAATTERRSIEMYKNSKLCNILFTIELAKRLVSTGVTTNTLHPGAVKTEFFDKVREGTFKKFAMFMADSFFLSAVEGAQTQIYLAVSQDVEGVSGELFTNCTQIRMYKTAEDSELARRLWDKSEEFSKLTDDEKLRF